MENQNDGLPIQPNVGSQPNANEQNPLIGATEQNVPQQPMISGQPEAVGQIPPQPAKSKKTTTIILIVVTALVVIGGIIATILLLNNGNGGNDPNKPIAQKNEDNKNRNLEIKESGWSYISNDDDDNYSDNHISYGVEIYNPYKDMAVTSATIKHTGKDNDGNILFVEKDYIFNIHPEETIYYGYTFSADEKPAKIESEIETEKYEWIDNSEMEVPKSDTQVFSNVTKKESRYGATQFLGEVKNNSSTNVDLSRIIIIYRKDGKIVGGDEEYNKNNLEAGEKTSFNIITFYEPDYDEYELQAALEVPLEDLPEEDI